MARLPRLQKPFGEPPFKGWETARLIGSGAVSYWMAWYGWYGMVWVAWMVSYKAKVHRTNEQSAVVADLHDHHLCMGGPLFRLRLYYITLSYYIDGRWPMAG